MHEKAVIEKLCRARMFDDIAARKAKAFVSDVIVIVGPACLIARRSRFDAGKLSGVWSMALQITKMSSTPIPSIIIGMV